MRLAVVAEAKSKKGLCHIHSDLGTNFRLVRGLGALLALRLVGLGHFRDRLLQADGLKIVS